MLALASGLGYCPAVSGFSGPELLHRKRPMTDFATQRKFMVDTQVRPSDVTDRRIIRAMMEVPREAFVPAAVQQIAYMDEQLRLTDDKPSRYLLAPRTLAKMIQSLDVTADDAVLDIGGGTGYSAAVLAKLAKRVVVVETAPALVDLARAQLAALPAVKLVTGDLAAGAAGDGPYDAILVNGAVEDIPAPLLDQLKDQGRLVAIRTVKGVGRATLWRRYGVKFDHGDLFDAGAPILPGFERKAEFVF